jgi:hypothetical protein
MQTLRLPLPPRRGTVPPMQDEAFFRRLGDDLFEASEHTRGPWSPKHQHAGPPSALVCGQLEAMCSDAFRVVRVAVEILRPVPIGTLRLERSVRRDGTMVKALTGHLFDGEAKLVIAAEALALAEAELGLEGTAPPMDEAPPGAGRPERFPFFDAGTNYAGAMEGRFTRGTFGDGDVMAWLRTRIALVEGEPPSPLERVMIAADSGNGVSQRLPTRDFTFVNPDLTVTLHRPLEGEWVGLAARTDYDSRGVGMADTRLYDARGPIGRGVQTLIVRRRPL